MFNLSTCVIDFGHCSRSFPEFDSTSSASLCLSAAIVATNTKCKQFVLCPPFCLVTSMNFTLGLLLARRLHSLQENSNIYLRISNQLSIASNKSSISKVLAAGALIWNSWSLKVEIICISCFRAHFWCPCLWLAAANFCKTFRIIWQQIISSPMLILFDVSRWPPTVQVAPK